MSQKLNTLQTALTEAMGARALALVSERGELTLTVSPADYLQVALELRDTPVLKF